MERRDVFRDDFKSQCCLSRWPNDCGCCGGVYLTIVPSMSCTFAHSFEMNAAPLSQSASVGKPKFLTHERRNALAHDSAVTVAMGIALTQRVVLQIIVRRWDMPSETGKGPNYRCK